MERMRSVAVIILGAFVVQAHAKESMHKFADELIDKFADRWFKPTLKTTPLHPDLDKTTLRKSGHLATSLQPKASFYTSLRPSSLVGSQHQAAPGIIPHWQPEHKVAKLSSTKAVRGGLPPSRSLTVVPQAEPAIETQMQESLPVSASDAFKASSGIDPALYDEAKKDRLQFWEARAKELEWFEPWSEVLQWKRPFAEWFVGGKLNAAYNCLDVHLKEKGNKKALIWEGEKGGVREFTYRELYEAVSGLASKMKTTLGVQKGDRVIIYMPMVPELAIAVLACARIGAVHSVVFGGFSAKALKDRIETTEPSCIITADGGYRRGKAIALKKMVDTALEELASAGDGGEPKVVVVKSLDEADRGGITMKPGRDMYYDDLVEGAPAEFPAEQMDSEDPLFILYSSGSTGKPKGILHTTGGYMTHAKYSTRTVFDLRDDDVYWCTADVGWITGHTYLVYGPLANGATIVMFEGAPDFPGRDRFWDVIERHKVSVFYTAPTAIRAFMKWGLEHVKKHDLSSLRMLGTVGEPINPEAWKWYHEHIGGGRCPIVDTWWQTETGGIMVANIPALNDMKPGCAGLPLPGIEVGVLGEDSKVIQNGGGYLSITQPWPSMLRGLYNDNKRYENTYWNRFDTYFAGDGATIDEDGYIKVLGRVDDVLNVAGHRLGTMELESAFVGCDGIAEAAVVGMPDDLRGQAILAFIIVKEGVEPNDEKRNQLVQQVVKDIGPFARPQHILFTPDLPKTRSGKIMRRILKSLVVGEPIGETSTLANPDIVTDLQKSMVEACLIDESCMLNDQVS
eukprot:gnl/MRDRNA2_/MRDRNA2_41505_c0_seq1.p1 gnl/MRDRNA2_/MRDRNA2_41505_c0~~gnl/MRDRNA2_/MRDRNA2_41505_c0_seq1.p1  ORF type:complete len:795 (+),score=134.54 gnl/MRDRNA2_/MRDRNA2_41505_c0_seq1:114-2498(+)